MSGRVQTPHLRDRCASRFCSGLVYIPENWIFGARGINSHKLRIALQQHRAGAHMLAAPAEMLGGGELPLIKWLLRSGCDSLQFDDLPAPSMKTRPHLFRKRISAAILDTACRPPPHEKACCASDGKVDASQARSKISRAWRPKSLARLQSLLALETSSRHLSTLMDNSFERPQAKQKQEVSHVVMSRGKSYEYEY